MFYRYIPFLVSVGQMFLLIIPYVNIYYDVTVRMQPMLEISYNLM